MKDSTKHESLLEDMFQAGVNPDFEKKSLADLLTNVRSKRTHQRARKFAGAMLAVAALALSIFFLHEFQPAMDTPQAQNPPAASPAYLVRTQPMDASQVVTTKPQGIPLVKTSRRAAPVVRTDYQTSSSKRIGDHELIALFPEQPVTLVQYSPSGAELMLFDNEEGWHSAEER